MARSARSDSTASDASFDGDDERGFEKKSLSAAAYRDDDDGEDANAPLDEEERLGLIQPATAKPRRLPSALAGSRKRLIVTALALIAALLLVVPLLAWLSSSHPTHDPWKHVEVVIPGWTSPPNPSILPASTRHRPSSNDAKGQWGLANAPAFSVAEYVPGWATPEEADDELALPKGTTRGTLARQGLRSLKQVTLDTIFNGTLDAGDDRLDWSAEDPDEGVFMRVDTATGDVIFEDVTHARKEQTGQGEVAKGGGKVTYFQGKDVKDAEGNQLSWDEFHPSPDLSHVVFFTDVVDVWRHSRRFNLWLYDVRTKKTVPLAGGSSNPPTVSNVAWLPGKSGAHSLAWVQNNDLYVLLDAQTTTASTPIRITTDGTATIFNGAADWVYEEEVLETDHAIWVSPNGTKIAYLRFDETEVPTYEFPIYAGGEDKTHAGKITPYPAKVAMKYPKPGYPNPIVSAHVVDLERLRRDPRDVQGAKMDLASPSSVTDASLDGGQPNRVDLALGSIDGQKQRLIIDVAWLDDSQLYLVETNRYSDKARSLVFDLSGSASQQRVVGKAVRHRDVGSSSWITPRHDLVALGAGREAPKTTAYLEVMNNEAGYAHIAFFPSAEAAKPSRWLTSGEWEVDALLFADNRRSKAYYSAAVPGAPWRRHIYAVGLDANAQHAAGAAASPVDVTSAWPASSFEASFDPKGAYVELRCIGPSVPWTRVVGLDDPTFSWDVQTNAAARNASAQHVKAHSLFYNVTLNGTSTSTSTANELRPHDFDASGSVRYPLLIHVYGGPDSQVVQHKYLRTHWHEHLATQLGYLVVRLDGRGTGFRGQAYREPVARNLGNFEAQDVLAAVRELRKLPYVDEKRVGVWGWSYGGYLTAKVVEADSHTVGLGMSVAPPTRWELYDSVYTERFMKSPGRNDSASGEGEEANAVGYEKGAVHVLPDGGFAHTHYLLAHGTGDDNVHFSNSAQLLDLLESSTPPSSSSPATMWTFRPFIDSPHGMSVRRGYRALHEWMTAWMAERWGAGGKRRFAEAGEVGKGGKGGQHGKGGKKKASKLLEDHSRREIGGDEEQRERPAPRRRARSRLAV